MGHKKTPKGQRLTGVFRELQQFHEGNCLDSGGGGGIRTHDAVLAAYSLSRGAPSATRARLRKNEILTRLLRRVAIGAKSQAKFIGWTPGIGPDRKPCA